MVNRRNSLRWLHTSAVIPLIVGSVVIPPAAQSQRTSIATTSSRGGYRPAPSPYADASRLPPPTRTAATQQTSGTGVQGGLAGRISGGARPGSAPATRRRAPNPAIFDRLSAGLASVERPGQRRGQSPPPEPPAQASTTYGGRGSGRGRRQKPAWARGEVGQGGGSGGGHVSESEAAHLAEVLNGLLPTVSEGGPPR